MYKIKCIDYDSKRQRHRHWRISKVTAGPRRLRKVARSVGAGGTIDEARGMFTWEYGSMPSLYITPKGIYCQKNTKVAQNSAARVASILIANKCASGKRGKWLKGVASHSSISVSWSPFARTQAHRAGGTRRLV